MKFFRRASEQYISQVVVLAMVFGFTAGILEGDFRSVDTASRSKTGDGIPPFEGRCDQRPAPFSSKRAILRDR